MARARVEINGAAIAALLKSNEVRGELTRRGEAALDAAKSSAPVVSGSYRDGLEIQQGTTDRAVVRVAGTAAHSLVVESRTGNLARALDAAGGS